MWRVTWIVLLILPYSSVTSKPVDFETNAQIQQIPTVNSDNFLTDAQNIPKSTNDGEIISVRITSSIAVDRGKIKQFENVNRYDTSSQKPVEYDIYNPSTADVGETTAATEFTDFSTIPTTVAEADKHTDVPPTVEGANMEFIKQLQAKKGQRDVNKFEGNHSYQSDKEENDNVANESEIKSSIDLNRDSEEDDEDVPLARSVPLSYSSRRYFQDSTQRSQGAYKLTTVNFNVVHDVKEANPGGQNGYASNDRAPDVQTFYSEPAKVYSKPAQVYSEPAKYYSEPAKIYSEPAKIYSEPAKIYSEPAKIYSEPAKFYSQPASLHLDSRQPSPSWKHTDGFHRATTPASLISSTAEARKIPEHQPEKNYEVDEKVSVMTDGRSHGVQQNPENCKQENCKVGYVVEGRQFRKYRVEERTSDGFIVGEYGVVRNEDGALRGVRYTADSEASPSLIHDALMKFLQLK